MSTRNQKLIGQPNPQLGGWVQIGLTSHSATASKHYPIINQVKMS